MLRIVVLVIAIGILAAVSASAQPDLRQMSGVPLPVSDIAVGTVTVRVVRGSLANVVPAHDVQLIVDGASRTAKTNDAGRAEFAGLTPGVRVRATTTVVAERLESQEFAVPASGGIRLMLVGADPAGASGPAAVAGGGTSALNVQPGEVALGEQSRFVFEMGDEALTGFYILQVVNAASTPVSPSRPFVLDLPEGASQASILQGSSPQGTAAGSRVSIAGPFAPGPTLVQVAFTLPYSGATLAIEQTVPVALAQMTLLVEKVGQMQVTSPQISQQRDVAAQGDTYLLGQGPGLAAGSTFRVALAGLPHAALWPRNVALGLAFAIVAAGAWASIRPARANAAWVSRRQKLQVKRERLLDQLTGLEQQQRAGAIEPARYEARRSELMRALERVYAEIDEDAAA
jgi:hypothetical protein